MNDKQDVPDLNIKPKRRNSIDLNCLGKKLEEKKYLTLFGNF